MPLLTITDNFGAEGIEIAQIVARKLGVEVFDDGCLQKIVTGIGILSIESLKKGRAPLEALPYTAMTADFILDAYCFEALPLLPSDFTGNF